MKRFILLALLLVAPCTLADEAVARLSGQVTDRTGTPVAAATVTAVELSSGRAGSATSDAAGRYAFTALAPGRYRVSVSAPGLEAVERDQVDVGAAAEALADFTLDVARRKAYVEVAATTERPLLVETDPRTPRQPMPAHDGADYLKTIPGFAVIRKGGTDGDPVLRGMAGSRLGVLLDGENVLGGCGSRMDPPTAYAFPEAYDRVTVLKGPQTVAQGPGNSAGVVLFERERERFSAPGLRAYLSPTFGSFGRNDQVADLQAGGRKGYLQASATRSAADDYEDGAGQAVHSSYERWSANAALGFTPDERTRFELTGARSDGEAAYADRMMDGVKFDRENVGLRFERQGATPDGPAFEAQAFYNYVDHVMDNYSLRTFVPSMMMPKPAVSNPDRRTVGARATATFKLGAATRAKLGGDWQENRHSVRSSSNQTADPYEAHARVRDASFTNGGAFGELTRSLGGPGRLVAGARLDWWSGEDLRTSVATGMGSTAQPNPTAGLKRDETLPSAFARYERDLAAGTTLYAGLGHARRAPDYWELVSKESATSLSAFETRPERTTQLDAGLLFRKGRLSGSLALFANDVNDYILIESNYAKAAAPMGGMVGMTGMGGMATTTRKTTITRNVDTSSWGGEASLAWKPARLLALDASLAYVRGRNQTDDRPLAQQPPLEGRLNARLDTDAWSVGLLVRLVAAQDRYALNQGNIVGQDLGPTPAFGVLSLNAAWRVTRRLGLTAGVDNLLDEQYAEFVSRNGAMVPGFTTTTRVNEPGRSAWVKLDLRY